MITDGIVLVSGIVMAIVASILVGQGAIEGYEAAIATVAMMSSFGPTVAILSLSNNLNLTLASGNRVLNLLAEEPIIEEVKNGTDAGKILYGNQNVNDINTLALRKHISYVTQETHLFHDTIENNIKIAKADAAREEVIEAAKKLLFMTLL